jgi:hypothetical protein
MTILGFFCAMSLTTLFPLIKLIRNDPLKYKENEVMGGREITRRMEIN